MSRTSKYIAGISTGYLVTIANIVVSLALTPYILNYLNSEEYGVFTLGANVIMFLSLIDIGIAAGINVHLAQNVGRINSEDISRYASSGFFVQLVIVAVVMIGGLGVSLAFPIFFDVSPHLAESARWMMVILTGSTVLSLAVQPFSSILIAHQLIHVDNLIRLGLLLVRTVLTVVLVSRGLGILSLAIANFVATGITACLAIIRARIVVPQLHISYRLVSVDIIKAAGSTGIWFSLGGLAGLLIQNLDNTVAGKLVSLESVTTLAITGKVYLLFQGLLYQLTNTARPALGQLIGQGNMEQALKTYRQLFALSTGIAVIACATLWTINETFITVWVGKEHYGGLLLDFAFALNLVINVWIIPNRAVLSAGLIVRPQAISRLIEAVLNIGLSVWLTTQFGLVGVVISTALSAVVTSVFYLPYLTARMFRRQFWRFLWEDTRPILILLLLLVPTTSIMKMLTQTVGGYEGMILGLVSVSGLGAILLWRVVLNNDLHERISAILMARLNRREKFEDA